MEAAQGYAAIAAAVLVPIGIVVAVLHFRDDEASRNARITSTPGAKNT